MYIIKFIPLGNQLPQYFNSRFEPSQEKRQNVNFAKRYKSIKYIREYFKYRKFDKKETFGNLWTAIILYVKD